MTSNKLRKYTVSFMVVVLVQIVMVVAMDKSVEKMALATAGVGSETAQTGKRRHKPCPLQIFERKKKMLSNNEPIMNRK